MRQSPIPPSDLFTPPRPTFELTADQRTTAMKLLVALLTEAIDAPDHSGNREVGDEQDHA
jgi:hypothetical protein